MFSEKHLDAFIKTAQYLASLTIKQDIWKRVDIPREVDFRDTESRGLHLVNLLAEDQLHGDIKLERKEPAFTLNSK